MAVFQVSAAGIMPLGARMQRFPSPDGEPRGMDVIVMAPGAMARERTDSNFTNHRCLRPPCRLKLQQLPGIRVISTRRTWLNVRIFGDA